MGFFEFHELEGDESEFNHAEAEYGEDKVAAVLHRFGSNGGCGC